MLHKLEKLQNTIKCMPKSQHTITQCEVIPGADRGKKVAQKFLIDWFMFNCWVEKT